MKGVNKNGRIEKDKQESCIQTERTTYWWSGKCDYRNDINWKIYISKGITSAQISISKEFPEEYAAMTEKLAEAFEHTFVEES